MPSQMAPRVALVHDFLLDLRGGERVFAAICDAWPEADVFTAVYDEDGTEGRFAARSPRTSFLQRLRPSARTFRPLLPLYPYAVESLDLRGYELVISSSSAWAHGVLPDPGAVHVCYCHNPFRYAWSERDATLAARSAPFRLPLQVVLSRWRRWDWIAAQRVDRYVANSRLTASRVHRYFGREADVLHPPVELERFAPGPVGDHYLVVGELMPHKRVDVAVQAFNRLRRPLVVVGDGPQLRRLRRLAGPSVTFTGRLPDPAVADLMRRARALLVTAAEEFGIVAVEALASGRPVIALGAGGVQESVVEGETGTYFGNSDPDSLAAAVARFDPLGIDPAVCVAAARRFGTARFQAALRAIVDEAAAAERPPTDRHAVVTGLLPRRAARRAAARP
jgi:glycosyltransferase involved in cell wall biosynthesis